MLRNTVVRSVENRHLDDREKRAKRGKNDRMKVAARALFGDRLSSASGRTASLVKGDPLDLLDDQPLRWSFQRQGPKQVRIPVPAVLGSAAHPCAGPGRARRGGPPEQNAGGEMCWLQVLDILSNDAVEAGSDHGRAGVLVTVDVKDRVDAGTTKPERSTASTTEQL